MRVNKLKKAVLLVALALLIFVFTAVSGENDNESISVASLSELPVKQVDSLSESDSGVYLIYTDNSMRSNLLMLDYNGELIAQRVLEDYPSKIISYGNSYTLLNSTLNSTIVKTVDAKSEEVLSEYQLFETMVNFKFIDIDKYNNSYFVSVFSDQTLVKSNGSLDQFITFETSIEFLQTLNDFVYVYSGNKLHIIEVESYTIIKTVETQIFPHEIISDNILVGGDGCFYNINGEDVQKIGVGIVDTSAKENFTFNAVEDEDTIYYVKTADLLIKYELGIGDKSVVLDGEILHLGQKGVFYKSDEGIYYIEYDYLNFDDKDIEDDDVEGEEDENFDKSELSGYEVDGEYIFIPVGETVYQFRNKTGAKVYDAYDKLLTSGNTRTGYKIVLDDIQYTAVVMGDSNKSGTINTADIDAVMEHLVNKTILDSVGIMASDFNKDGKISAVDLLTLVIIVDEG